jgi:hypothetical protein
MKVRRIVNRRRKLFHAQGNAFVVDEWQFVWIGKELIAAKFLWAIGMHWEEMTVL